MPVISSLNAINGNEIVSLLDSLACADPADIDRIKSHIAARHIKSMAVLFTDLSGYSEITQNCQIESLVLVYQHQKRLKACIEEHKGRMIKTMGDSIMAIFADPQDALDCSIGIMSQDKISSRLTIGIGYGEIVSIGDIDVFGVEVNRASYLAEDFGLPGQLLITDGIANRVENVGLLKIDIQKDWNAYAVVPTRY